ncbi:MAG: HAMP domain-containing sensor histidine kinase [Cytophagales bacterium]
MRLNRQYNRIYIYLTIIVFVASLITSYFGFKIVVLKNIDFSLAEEKNELVEEFKQGLYSQKHGELVDFEAVGPLKYLPKDKFKTVVLLDKHSKNKVSFREIISYFHNDNQTFKVTLKLHLDPHLNNIFTVFPYFILNFLAFVICFYLINSFFFKKTFTPFYQILSLLKIYDIQKGDYNPEIRTNIYEFKELNEIASNLTERVHKDYKIQKEFIENSSHEFKTPLAIINNQLDFLIQSENLTEKEMKHIEKIYDSVKRLTNLNKNLTFLFKIENQHFTDVQLLNINNYVSKLSIANAELFEDKNIKVIIHQPEAVQIKINELLLEILINNLINNAFKYAVSNSEIVVRTRNQTLEILNLINPDKINPEALFNRFVTSGDINSSGIGLSIVKKICDLYKIEINCTIFENLFSVHLSFPKSFTEHIDKEEDSLI